MHSGSSTADWWVLKICSAIKSVLNLSDMNKNSFCSFPSYLDTALTCQANFQATTDGKADTHFGNQLSTIYLSENKTQPLLHASTQDCYFNVEPKIITVVPLVTVQLRDWRNRLCAFISIFSISIPRYRTNLKYTCRNSFLDYPS